MLIEVPENTLTLQGDNLEQSIIEEGGSGEEKDWDLGESKFKFSVIVRL